MKIKLEDNTELTVTESCTATTITAEFDTAVEIEDKDTYFEIFKTSKNTTIATTAYNGSIHKK